MSLFNKLTGITHSKYWLSQNRLAWNNASSYCQTRCNSALASIHSYHDHQTIVNIISHTDSYNHRSQIPGFLHQTNDIWIGLNKLDDPNGDWKWSDDTSCEYGTDINSTSHTNPWTSWTGLGTQKCISYWNSTMGYKWRDEGCKNENRFLCNSCEGVLDKYILYDNRPYNDSSDPASSNWDDARAFCQSFDSNLASIHNEDDMESVKALCSTTFETGDCWIGLMVNSAQDWVWSDGTYFDFGNNISISGIYPWSNAQPLINSGESNNIPNCIYMDSSEDYQWTASWKDEKKNFVCNKPNELCYNDQWTQLSQPKGTVSFHGCNASMDNGSAVISGKKWTNDNLPIKIEYTFQVTSILCDTGYSEWNPEWNDVGITVHVYNGSATNTVDTNVCEYTFFGVAIKDNQVYKKTGVKWHNGEDQPHNVSLLNTLDFDGFTFEYDRYYTMTMELYSDNTGQLFTRMYFDGRFVTNTTFGSNYAYDNSKYFGIRNTNMSIIAKSFYISGTPEYIDGNHIDQCFPTSAPTTDATISFVIIFVFRVLFVNHEELD